MVGPLASLAAWPPEVMTSHSLAWLVRWHRWYRWQAARAEVMTSQLSHGWSIAMASLVRWLSEVMTHMQLSHGWSVGRLPRGHDVTGTALAWLVRWQLGWKIRS